MATCSGIMCRKQVDTLLVYIYRGCTLITNHLNVTDVLTKKNVAFVFGFESRPKPKNSNPKTQRFQAPNLNPKNFRVLKIFYLYQDI